MLVLARKQGETLHIGDITVTIVEIRGAKVRIAIDAPRDMAVVRAELLKGDTKGGEG